MASFLDRVRSIVRREPRNQDPDEGFAPVVGPNGVVKRPSRRHQDHPGRHHPNHDHPNRPHSPHQHPGSQPHHHPQHPAQPGDGMQQPLPRTPATRSGRLEIELHNDTNSNEVYAYITGQAIDNRNALFLLSADGNTPFFPGNPAAVGERIQHNISINLGAPGHRRRCTIPRLAGGRIWFSIGAPLVFGINPGPGLVEPSVFNQADPNHNVHFGFAEFTFNNAQVFANISYVDFVGLPIALTLEDTDRRIQHVSGLPQGGLETIAEGLRRQTARDGRRWSSLIVNNKAGRLLRILSPNSGILLNPSWFADYWTNYVNQVYGRYSNSRLTVNTQAGFGDVGGRAGGGQGIDFGSGGTFPKPSARDIFSCNTGPFATGANAEKNTIIPRLSAAFNRSTLLLTDDQPDGVGARQYYQNETTNHYARIVHNANLDGHGYAFPYDDVTPDGGVPQEGAAFSYSPALLTVSVGGRNAHVR